MTLKEEALHLHEQLKGKLEMNSKVQVQDEKDLSLAYSPGVAEPCKSIANDESKIYDYTALGNLVAVISDGSAVLGLGNIGPRAAMPVMEGKSILFKSFADIDAFPLCLNSTDVKEVVNTVKMLETNFSGINLEDIAAPRCFEIEKRLKEECDIPIFHDDQHGTAIVTAAGIINALKISRKSLSNIKVVVSGAGSAGIAVIKLLYQMGVKNIIMCDSKGIVYKGRSFGMNPIKEEIAHITNQEKKTGDLSDALRGADIFVGVSTAGIVTNEMIKSMNPDSVIFAMANPDPEIMPDMAKKAGALVVGTGHSDFPNQVNNVLAFPGVFRGALDVRAREINEDMKIAAVHALADIIPLQELNLDYVIPKPFDERVVTKVSKAVSQAAIDSGVAGKQLFEESYV